MTSAEVVSGVEEKRRTFPLYRGVNPFCVCIVIKLYVGANMGRRPKRDRYPMKPLVKQID